MTSHVLWRSILKGSPCEEECLLQRPSAICAFLSTKSHAPRPETFFTLLKECKEFTQTVFRSANSGDILLGIQALEDTLLIKHVVGDDFLKESLELLCSLLKTSEDARVTERAALAIGVFVSKSGGAFADKIVDQVVWALKCLENDDATSCERMNGINLLRSIAEFAPAAFNIHVQKFLNLIWKGLRAEEKEMRVASANAVGACLSVIEQRKTRNRVKWFNKLATDALAGLRSQSDMATLHGSLLVISKLMQYSGEFMLARYEEVTSQTLSRRLEDHNVNMVILELIPLFADFFPERFLERHMSAAMTIVLSPTRDGGLSDASEEEIASLRSLRGLTLTTNDLGMQTTLMRWIQDIVQKLENAFDLNRTERMHHEALECCGVLAECLKTEWTTYAEQLLFSMTMTGISSALANCLQKTVTHIPELKVTIREKLLDVVFLLLIDEPFTKTVQSELRARIRELRSPRLVDVALEVLSSFDFGDLSFLDVALEHVCHLLAVNPSCRVRAAAANCCIHVAKRHINASSVYDEASIHILLERLVTHGTSDPKECVRYAVWGELLNCPELDEALLKCPAAQLLFIGLGDVSLNVRLAALRLAGRLICHHGSVEKDTIVEVITQLLQQLEFSFDKEQNRVNSQVLSQLIQSCPSVVEPRANMICKSLIHLLKRQLQPPRTESSTGSIPEGHSASATWLRERFSWTSTGVVAAALETAGHLADHVGASIESSSLQTLMELTVAALQKVEIETDSIEAVRTLGKIVSSTGAVDKPYHQFSWLLMRLLDMLQVDDPEVRTAVTRTLGILGAIDPSIQRRIQAQASGEGRLELEGVRPINKATDDSAVEGRHPLDKGPVDLLMVQSMRINSEESYSLLAMNALLKVLKQHSLSAFHRGAIHVLGTITSSLSTSSVQYLNILVPNWCDAVYSGDEEMKHYILEHFVLLVRVVKQHVRHFLKHLMKLVQDLWTDNCTEEILDALLHLVHEIATMCRHDLREHFGWLVPRMIRLLQTEAWHLVPITLRMIVAFGPSLQQHFHQLLPCVMQMLLSRSMRGREDVQTSILTCLEELGSSLCLPELVGFVLVPLLRILHQSEALEKEKVADTIATIAYAARLETDALQRIGCLIHVKGIHSVKFKTLSANQNLHRSTSGQNIDLKASWRNLFERTLRPLSADAQDEQRARHEPFSDTDLRRVWNTDQTYTYQDWLEWMRAFSLELLRSSPSPALRACHMFAQHIPSMTKDLFSASFVACWSELLPDAQSQFIRHLEAAMASNTIPPEILTTLLNLAEFMEHNNYQLPLDKRTLAALSMKCQAFAKALHYKELEFQDNPRHAVENMLAIYNQCFLPAAADGLLAYARDVLKMPITRSWYEKLHKWETALGMYEDLCLEPFLEIEESIRARLGCMRCYAALWDWPKLNELCRKQWPSSDPAVRKQIAPLAAQAAWKMGQWQAMPRYLDAVDVDEDNDSDASTCAFLCSVNKIHLHKFDEAQHFIDKARQFLSADLAALSGESYERAYEKMVRVQQLAELEEVMQVIQSQEKGDTQRAHHIMRYWKTRLDVVQQRAEVWESCLSVRRLVLSPEEDTATWMKFADMCRKQDKGRFAESFLRSLLGYDPEVIPKGQSGYSGGKGNPEMMFAFLKHAFGSAQSSPKSVPRIMDRATVIERLDDMIRTDGLKNQSAEAEGLDIFRPSVSLVSRAYVTLAKWRRTCCGNELNPQHIQTLIDLSDKACQFAPDWAKAWRDWAVYHLVAIEYYNDKSSDLARDYVAPAVRGFFKALQLSQDCALHGGMLGSGPSKDTYQDILRLLTLWFSHGDAPRVIDELTRGFASVRIETWIVVIPQIIARIDVRWPHVQDLIHQLLKKIGQAHPQALLYPILIASNNEGGGRRSTTLEALDLMRLTYPLLINEGELIAQRFVNIAVFWDEKWHESFEEASKLYFTESNIPHMMDLLIPLHQDLQRVPAVTNSERNFVANYADQLNEAYELLRQYQACEDLTAIQKAWDIYYSVFRKIDASIGEIRVLHLSDLAPDLLDRSMLVAIPGTYSPFQSEQVCIERIVPEIEVMRTKQRPRRLTIEGNDGHSYMFLLKGHEDLRQDERVMQLFGLVNTILASDFEASQRELSIARYAVTPLSPNVGLIGWVPNCDTLHTLIKEHREARGISVNLEHRMMKEFASHCDTLTIIQKVEVFRHVLDCTAGDDLKKTMWIKSSSSEHWLAHRTNYIRSCAVMSIVGYFLGLGDRHPSNLMIDRYSGKLVHIDFGDCFETGMIREKFPEKVPFRLTRMMVKAMEVTGVEGTFRKTCQLVMQVLRAEKLTVMAMLEAFVYDPLINWRLACVYTKEDDEMVRGGGDAHEMLNARALQVTNRIKLKLSGRELDADQSGLTVSEQVEHIIKEATSHVNLCQAYVGWCPFW